MLRRLVRRLRGRFELTLILRDGREWLGVEACDVGTLADSLVVDLADGTVIGCDLSNVVTMLVTA